MEWRPHPRAVRRRAWHPWLHGRPVSPPPTRLAGIVRPCLTSRERALGCDSERRPAVAARDASPVIATRHPGGTSATRTSWAARCLLLGPLWCEAICRTGPPSPVGTQPRLCVAGGESDRL